MIEKINKLLETRSIIELSEQLQISRQALTSYLNGVHKARPERQIRIDALLAGKDGFKRDPNWITPTAKEVEVVVMKKGGRLKVARELNVSPMTPWNWIKAKTKITEYTWKLLNNL